MGIGYIHLNCDNKKFGTNSDPFVRAGYLCLIQSLAFGGRGLGVVPHPYYTQQSGTSDHPYHGLFNSEPGHLFLAGDFDVAGWTNCGETTWG